MDLCELLSLSEVVGQARFSGVESLLHYCFRFEKVTRSLSCVNLLVRVMSARLPVVDNTVGLPSTSLSPRGPVTDGDAVGDKELVILRRG